MLKHLTVNDFDSVVANGGVLVDFYANWCGPCKMVAPVLEGLAELHPDVTICKVNVDEEMELARRFGVMSIPTLLFFKDGELVDKVVGALPKPALEAKLALIK